MPFVRVQVVAMSALILTLAGCQSGHSRPSSHADATKEQMLAQAQQMNANGQHLRSDALEKKRQGHAAESDKETAQADKMIDDAKMLKDRALLRDSQNSE